MLIHFIYVGYVIFFLLGVVISFIAWRKINKYLEHKKRRELAALLEYHHRLRSVLSDLLDKANELDQASKFMTGQPSIEWSSLLESSCSKLVKLGESLKRIEESLVEGEVGATREYIIDSCSSANEVKRQLETLRSNQKLLGGGFSKS